MPDLRTYKLAHICGLFDEAIRTIPGYDKYDPTYEPKALIDYEKTKDNYAIYINPCMRHEKGVRSREAKSAKVKALIKEKTGKEPRKDAVACSLILTLPRDYAGDPKEFFENAVEALCIIMGIKREDILYACVHMDESQPHLHFAFLPMAYVKDYDAKLDAFNAAKAKAKADGTKVPARPSYLKGDINRKVEEDETPITMNCGRFGKGFLHYLNKTIEERLNDVGIEANIATGRGSQFDPQLLPKKQREESLKLYEENEKLRKELKKLETDKVTLQSEAAKATEEMEAAQAEALAAKSQAAEATLEVAKAKEELEQAKDLLEEKEIELSEKLEQVASLRELIKDLKEELARLVKEVTLFVPNVVKSFIGKWKEAKTISQMEKVDTEAREEAIAGAKALTENLRVFGTRAEALLAEEEVVSGVKMATFERTDQKVGFAKKQVLKAAEATGQAEAFEDERVMALALQDWFNREKYKEILERKSEVEASLYMKAPLRAERAIEYALEKVEEMEEVELG